MFFLFAEEIKMAKETKIHLQRITERVKEKQIKEFFEKALEYLQLPLSKSTHLREIFYYFLSHKGKGIFYRLLDPFQQNKEELVVPFIELCLMRVAWSFEINLLTLINVLNTVKDVVVINRSDNKVSEEELRLLSDKARTLDQTTVENYFHKLASLDSQTNMKAILKSLIALAGTRCDMRKEQIVDALYYVDYFLSCPPSTFHQR